VRAVNLHSRLGLPETPMLFLEFHGTEAGVAEQSQRFGEIATEFGGGPFEWTTRAEDRTRLWEARHNAALANFALRPGSSMIATDVCVPISRLAEAIKGTKEDLAKSSLVAPMVGHVGDGNFHLIMLIDPEKPEEVAEAKRIHDRMVARVLSLDGTCTGEHGIGEGKIKFLEAEHGEGIAVMRAIKQALDPLNILNPGKMFSA
jgi:D-lactate dehydrogenase (cytochrome)